MNGPLMPMQQQTQNVIMSQQQLQSLKMLELTTQELESFLQEEFMKNPALEWKSRNDRHYSSAPPEDPYAVGASCELYSDEEQWKQHVIDQLQKQPSFAENTAVYMQLLAWVDEDGLFRTPIAEFCEANDVLPRVAQDCLAVLRTLEPAGIFAEDTAHCLLIQAKQQGVLDEALECIILHYMNEVASGYYAKAAGEMHLSRKKFAEYVELLRNLSPHPLNGSTGDAAGCVVPDITLRRSGDNWEILLGEHLDGDYCVSAYCASLYREADTAELRSYLKSELDRARLIVNALAQRRETILNLVGAIIQFQRAWLENRGPLTPMTMSQLAEQLKVHPSTVSRTVKGKYIETPTRGTFAMRSLFSQEVSAEGVSTNAAEVCARIRQLIENEPHDAPHSDEKLCALLEEEGICISRRTVAKYRKEMCIPSAFGRRG